MSFNAKNLSYEKNEPAFLRKLRSEYGDGSGFRNDRPSPRPTKKKDADDDDAPTYVDEGSNEIISKEEYEALVRGDSDNTIGISSGNNGNENEKARPTNDTGDGGEQEEPQGPKDKQKQHFAEIGGAKKRKQARVIGEDAAEDATRKPPASRKPKLKKKIKLSFDDDE
ncbi:ribosome assembly protein 1 [Blastomyces parvus]|uniref:Ribosome assembly protein 1 n=1 Tax=Blastomyces parvus TaxID=2060905 RepID=A0A2B7X3V4_9EURO|nr:ribosome assembly protein 1 [Blastomyces parvus]